MKKHEALNNQIFGKIINYGSYILVVGVLFVLAYLAFVDTLELTPNWKTATLFSVAGIFLSYTVWDVFYHKQYNKTINDDYIKASRDEYSIQFRYYIATKDWTDLALQKCIDDFNDDYTTKWLTWVEKITGVPIHTCKKKVVDPITNKESVVDVIGIMDLPYKGFYHKILMWRIKHHKYPKSGYKTSQELLSLFSSQDTDFRERKLHPDKTFFISHAISKLLTSILTIVVGASISINFIQGHYLEATLKLIIAVGTVFSSVFFGAFNGIKGAKLKLSVVEAVCFDLEKWAGIKPKITPYEKPIPKLQEPNVVSELIEKKSVVTSDIFSELNIPKE